MTVEAYRTINPDEVRSRGALRSFSLSQQAGIARKRPKLAIVSTFDDLCGIAGYTRALLPQLEPYFDIEVFDLDQFFMRSPDQRVRKLADGMIRAFCARASDFDFINIQLEHGTLGRTNFDIVKRFSMIAKSAPALSVTFHTVLLPEPFSIGRLLNHLIHGRFNEALKCFQTLRGPGFMNRQMYRLLRTLQLVKPVNIIVHTRRDMRVMRYVNGFKSVYDHPLAFLPLPAAQSLRAKARERTIAGLGKLPPGAKVVGVFGFLSEYKGIDTVIKAMHKLPDEYHLLIFGGLHPNEIRKGVKIHAYVDLLLKEAKVGRTVLDDVDDHKPVTLQLDRHSLKLVTAHPNDIGARIHFLGPQTDEGFAAHMATCDHVVLPYLEIGQSSSGVLSIAVEMGCRVIAARNHAFMQYARYHPDCVELFEVGNFLELAEKIQAEPACPASARKLSYTVETNAETYLAANTAGSWRKQRGVPADRERATVQA